MPLTTGLTSLTAAKGEGHIHSDKWHRCIQHVKAKGGGYDPYAVCTFSIGYNESINKEHQTPGPHSSRDTRRFKRRKERQEKEQKIDFAAVLKYNKCHDTGSGHTGHFASNCGSGGSGSGKALSGKERDLAMDAARKKRSGKGVALSTSLSPSQKQMQIELARQAKKPVHKVHNAEEAVALVLKGENVEIQDTKHVHTLLKKLGEMAIEAKKNKSEAANFDPCTITVKGVSLFCSEKIKTKEFPHGIPRIEMPQFKSKNPVPGSEADKLPRKHGEVDATQAFLDHLEASGVKTDPNGKMLARKLKASQAEMEGAKVAGMMLNPEFNPKVSKITVSRDGYVVDGHHTWAAAIGRDAEDGNLDNDKEMEVAVIDLPMSEIYLLSKQWTKTFGLPAAGVKKMEYHTVLRRTYAAA
jgi:hypothetical protein